MNTVQVLTKQVARVQKALGLLPYLVLIAAITIVVAPQTGKTQHFTSDPASITRVVVEADDLDSTIYYRATPFAVPAIPDSVGLVYHEPLPDSVMPRSAIVLGKVTIQAEEAEDIVEQLEEFARKQGADWVISFEEPRRRKNRDGDFYYRSSAILMRVLDDAMIPQSQIAYRTFNDSGHNNYAAVISWYDTYGRYMGANVKQNADPRSEEDLFEDTDE